LRHLLISLSVAGLFQARWTEEINQEWISNLLDDRPDLDPAKLDRTRRLMNAALDQCLVGGYEPLIPQLSLPDPDDRHVLAAAITAKAEVIITFNLVDFPAQELSKYGVEAKHPDDFVVSLIEENSQEVCKAVEGVRLSLVNPPKTPEQYLDTLEKNGLTHAVVALRKHCYDSIIEPLRQP
jgi:predicted nucleic acid-binding protein